MLSIRSILALRLGLLPLSILTLRLHLLLGAVLPLNLRLLCLLPSSVVGPGGSARTRDRAAGPFALLLWAIVAPVAFAPAPLTCVSKRRRSRKHTK